MTMRHFINLLEDLSNQPVEHDLDGNVDLTGLIKMLPFIKDAPRFISAFNKVKGGQGNTLDLNEKNQFVMAFISLLGLSVQQRQQVINKLIPLTVKPTLKAQGAPNSQQQGQPSQQAQPAPPPPQNGQNNNA